MNMESYTLDNGNGLRAKILNPGLILQELTLLLPDGEIRSLTLGFKDASHYIHPDYLKNYPYLGAVIGRIANRIRHAKFRWKEKEKNLDSNDGLHCLHGGKDGFDKKYWQLEEQSAEKLVFSLSSEDGEGGFPGFIHIIASIQVEKSNTLTISFEVKAEEECPVNLTWHPYFNLNPGHQHAEKHLMKIPGFSILATHEDLSISGEFKPVKDSKYDFNDFKTLSQANLSGGIDAGYILSPHPQSTMQLAAELLSSDNKVHMKVSTDNPIVHVYTGAHLPTLQISNEEPLSAFKGICFECQEYTDMVNNPHFPQRYASPDVEFIQKTSYQFITHSYDA
jgi:aldose 1-epimerase